MVTGSNVGAAARTCTVCAGISFPGGGGTSLGIQNDGNLVIDDFNGGVLWQSATCCH
jgi:hypothetical protein